MEVEDEDAILERLFFKKYGRALPEEKEKESDVDKINFVIDLTDEKEENEMEVATSEVVPVAVVKTEPIEISSDLNESAAAKVAADRKERRELVKGRKALIAFGKTLRKSVQIPEKEAPKVSADSNVSADASGTTVESLTTDEAIEMAEAAIAESDAAVNQKVMDEFDDESEFRLYRSEDDVIEDDDDDMIDDV